MVRFLGKTLVGESLSRRAEISRAGLLQRLERYIKINGKLKTISAVIINREKEEEIKIFALPPIMLLKARPSVSLFYV
jgi:hypothetical protein